MSDDDFLNDCGGLSDDNCVMNFRNKFIQVARIFNLANRRELIIPQVFEF
jgi:hypothetical protein